MAIVIVNERTDKTTDKQKRMIPSFAIKLEIECVSIANEHLLIYEQFLHRLSLADHFIFFSLQKLFGRKNSYRFHKQIAN